MTAEFKGGASVPIGQPIANMRCYVLDAQQQLLPIGMPGELMVSGIQLAHGYLKRPELTAEKFIPNPLSGGDPKHARLYRTGAGKQRGARTLACSELCADWPAGCVGDLARWLPDGALEFLGRTDNQVCKQSWPLGTGLSACKLNCIIPLHD